MTDYHSVYNPFDFANPVGNPTLFAGRDSELSDIRYYLDQARRAPRAINLALIGGRASGKTSLLNMIEFEAAERGFCTVRVDLDESDVGSQLVLFQKLFDSLVTTVVAEGAFGGVQGHTYQTYRDMVDAYEIPDDKLSCPFIFPLQYCKAMAAGNLGAPVSDVGYRRDIACVQQVLGRPVALLIDEGDVLSRDRAQLEKLRNIFMNTAGYMLVVTGTDSLFSVLDEVFSPIARQFKRIIVAPFEEEEETEACIVSALDSIGRIPVDAALVESVHELSGGRPYEVQLICHFLFKSVQQGKSRAMQLTVDVLDDVLSELQAPEDSSERPVIAAIRQLDRQQLHALSVVCFSGGDTSFDEAWLQEYVIYGEERWTREELSAHLAKLVDTGVLIIVDERVNYAGDDLDRIYCKFYAEKHRVRLTPQVLPPEILLAVRISHEICGSCERLESFHNIELGPEQGSLLSIATRLNSGQDPKAGDNPFDAAPLLAEMLYEKSVENSAYREYQALAVSASTQWFRFQTWFAIDPDGPFMHTPPEKVADCLTQWSSRASDLGATVSWEIHAIPVVPLEKLRPLLLAANTEESRRWAASFHTEITVEAYTEHRDPKTANLHAALALEYGLERTGRALNNIGYLKMACGELAEAIELLAEAAATAREPRTPTLSRYNLAICYAMAGDWVRTAGLLAAASEGLDCADESDLSAACVFVPALTDDGVQFVEQFEVDLVEAIQIAQEIAAALSTDSACASAQRRGAG